MASISSTARVTSALILMLAANAGASVDLISGTGTDKMTINTNKAALVVDGASVRTTYTATVSGATTTAAYNLQVESGAAAGQGFKVVRICVGYALGATAAGTIITTTVSRRTTASSGGTLLTNEGTGVTAVSKHDSTAANFPGVSRGLAATLGTAGATLDQWQFPQTVVAGTTGITPISIVCKDYPSRGAQAIINPIGTANGIAVNVSLGGAGSLAVGTIAMTFIVE